MVAARQSHTPVSSRWHGPRRAIRNLDPGCFAIVMATGIVSQAMRLDGAAWLSGLLLGTAIAAYLLLAAAFAGRLARYRDLVRADAHDPRLAFGFFTLPAGSNVLAARLAGDGHAAVAAAALATGGISWAVLSCVLPRLLLRDAGPRRALAGANGTWFLWAVATQSVAVGITSLRPGCTAWPATSLAPRRRCRGWRRLGVTRHG